MKLHEREDLLKGLKVRFEKNMQRHKGTAWADVHAALQTSPGALRVLQKMELTGGEPDVIGLDGETGKYIFCDCSTESPVGRRSV